MRLLVTWSLVRVVSEANSLALGGHGRFSTVTITFSIIPKLCAAPSYGDLNTVFAHKLFAEQIRWSEVRRKLAEGKFFFLSP